MPEDFPTVSVCFYITFYFGSTLAFDILPKVEWKVRWFPCIFPLFCQYSIAVVSSCYCSFLWPVLLLCYIFLVILSLFSDCGCIPFSVCYDFFSLLSLVLEILFRCLGRLSAPTVFLLLPNFFCKRSPEIGRGRLQLSFCFYCWRETLGKAVSFLGFSLGVDYTASWVYFSTKTPCGIFTRARKRQIREETRMVQLCCWCRCMPPSSVSVLDKQLQLLFSYFSEKDSYVFKKQLFLGIC